MKSPEEQRAEAEYLGVLAREVQIGVQALMIEVDRLRKSAVNRSTKKALKIAAHQAEIMCVMIDEQRERFPLQSEIQTTDATSCQTPLDGVPLAQELSEMD